MLSTRLWNGVARNGAADPTKKHLGRDWGSKHCAELCCTSSTCQPAGNSRIISDKNHSEKLVSVPFLRLVMPLTFSMMNHVSLHFRDRCRIHVHTATKTEDLASNSTKRLPIELNGGHGGPLTMPSVSGSKSHTSTFNTLP